MMRVNNNKYKLQSFLTILFILGYLSMAQCQQKPNILFIAIDDLSDAASCMKSAVNVPTPNIDRLASQGTLFLNAHAQAPLCGPSRASIMTGLYPSTTGNYLMVKDSLIKTGSRAASKSIFMPDYFEQFGYKTMAVGKIYHGGDEAHTFQEYGGGFNNAGPIPEERVNYNPVGMPGKSGKTMTDWGYNVPHDSLMADYNSAKWAVNKLGQKHDKPFFLATGFNRPHVPWHVPKKWYDMFPLENIKTPPYLKNDLDDVPLMGKRVSAVPMMPTAEELTERGEWKEMLQAYYASVAFVDAQVGKVLDALEKSPYANNTIIVLWSDHGYHLGEKNRVAKHALWERATRVPLIIKDINTKGGQVSKAPVGLIDMYPTMIELCGLPPLEQLEGNSLVELMKRPNMKWEHPELMFYGEGNMVVRDGRFRLTRYEDNTMELYDMKKDPNEWYNLANDERHQKTIKKLEAYFPKTWAPLAQFSHYNINDYFLEKVRIKDEAYKKENSKK